jgi:hypothetical protein
MAQCGLRDIITKPFNAFPQPHMMDYNVLRCPVFLT